MSKVSKEVAEKDINAWLDFRKTKSKERELYKDSIEALVSAVMEGNLVFRKDDGKLVYTLDFPTEGDAPITKLEFKPRLLVTEIHQQTENDNKVSSNTIILANVAALTGVVKGALRKLDVSDYKICQSIAVFFL